MSDITVDPLEFKAFKKIPRLSRDIVITEKIDGTNAQVLVVQMVELPRTRDAELLYIDEVHGLGLLAGSRSRWLTPGKQDNHSFAAWAKSNAEELVKLGPGRHFGEWWGQGIQRRYGLQEKRFSLFNTEVWAPNEARPSCVDVVPVLYQGPWMDGNKFAPDAALEDLKAGGSRAAPGFMNPEGIVVYHRASGCYFKQTLEKDETPKNARVYPEWI